MHDCSKGSQCVCLCCRIDKKRGIFYLVFYTVAPFKFSTAAQFKFNLVEEYILPPRFNFVREPYLIGVYQVGLKLDKL